MKKTGPWQRAEEGREIKMQQVFMAGVTITKEKGSRLFRLGFNIFLHICRSMFN